jgi:hypothetical protein
MVKPSENLGEAGNSTRIVRINNGTQNTLYAQHESKDPFYHHKLFRKRLGEDIDIKRLSRRDFSYVGEDWQMIGTAKGFYYTLGIKGGYRDEEGDPLEVHFHFFVPFAQGGNELTDFELAGLFMRFQRLLCLTTQAYSAAHPRLRVLSIPSVEIPEFLMKTLEKIVG